MTKYNPLQHNPWQYALPYFDPGINEYALTHIPAGPANEDLRKALWEEAKSDPQLVQVLKDNGIYNKLYTVGRTPLVMNLKKKLEELNSGNSTTNPVPGMGGMPSTFFNPFNTDDIKKTGPTINTNTETHNPHGSDIYTDDAYGDGFGGYVDDGTRPDPTLPMPDDYDYYGSPVRPGGTGPHESKPFVGPGSPMPESEYDHTPTPTPTPTPSTPHSPGSISDDFVLNDWGKDSPLPDHLRNPSGKTKSEFLLDNYTNKGSHLPSYLGLQKERRGALANFLLSPIDNLRQDIASQRISGENLKDRVYSHYYRARHMGGAGLAGGLASAAGLGYLGHRLGNYGAHSLVRALGAEEGGTVDNIAGYAGSILGALGGAYAGYGVGSRSGKALYNLLHRNTTNGYGVQVPYINVR